ncbi:hypothetical protein SAMN05443633_107168 [Chryseobacterium arachidis]|uniref:AAA+ ATPase domain-containing protein n=1 Tax=Chryseobacterium arachidis TaxID=1416778 RepID=A0A1M5F517_9FLAO|nr:hypothetical protein [Chryseobacterium arachidis]SHF86649.1 hypothetical protein SAMN05443633_107168 [Chryseobacterium arachidis]
MKSISVKQALSIVFKQFEFKDLWLKAFGQPETTGFWYLGGAEKNGKTTFAMMLAKYLASFGKVLYVSAEEGFSKDIISAMVFAGLSDTEKNFKLLDYMPWEELVQKFESRKCPKIIFIDNTTVYRDEITRKMVLELKEKHKNKLIIFVSHEEKGLPDSALGTVWRKLSKIIVQAEGLRAIISGRCPGGTLNINEEKANLYWGTITENQ